MPPAPAPAPVRARRHSQHRPGINLVVDSHHRRRSSRCCYRRRRRRRQAGWCGRGRGCVGDARASRPGRRGLERLEARGAWAGIGTLLAAGAEWLSG